MVRDYASDALVFATGALRRARSLEGHERDTFPDFDSMPDPVAAVRDFNERHEPYEGNRHPRRPKVLHSKTVF